MNAIVARTLILIAVPLVGVVHVGTTRMDESEPPCFGPGTVNLVQEAPPNWLAVRIEAKHRFADDLIAGRRTLWDVAALFRDINNSPKDVPAGHLPDRGPHPMTFVPRTEEERIVLQVIGYVAARLYGDNPRRLEEIFRLEKQLLDELERNGVISLPESGD